MSSTQPHISASPEVRSLRLILTLGVAGFLSGLILVSTYLFTRPMIQANKAEDLREAIFHVLPGSVRYETLELENGQLVAVDPESAAEPNAPRIFAGFDSTDQLIGFAIPSEEPGYQDVIAGLFGYDPGQQQIIGFQVLESKETPGLGDKIIKDQDFLNNFKALSVDPEVVAVKNGEKTAPHQVEAITGATISSKAIVRLLNKGLKEWRQPMESYYQKHSSDE